MSRIEPTSRRCIHKLNRRQRKKLRVAEFQELACELELAFKAPLDDAAYAEFIYAFIDFAEARGLLLSAFGGSLPISRTDGLVSAERGSVSEEDRAALLAWLQARSEVESVTAGPLRDGWYGWAV